MNARSKLAGRLSAPWNLTIGVVCFALLLFGLSEKIGSAQDAEPSTDQRPWYKRSIVGMEVGPTGAQFGHSDPEDSRYCRLWDGREIVQRCVAANAEYLVLWLRDGDYAYYDSKLLPKAPGLGDRDPLREAMEEAKRHNLPIISYCVVQQGGIFLNDNPQWQMRDAQEQPIGRFCFNSGYLDAIKAMVAEQMEYGIDGFHIDMLDQGFGKPYGCWCETCQSQFQQRFGGPMPREVGWDRNWDQMLEFRYETSARFEQELTAYIKSINPAVTVDYNYHGSPPFSFEVGQRPVQHAGNGDFVTGETGVWGFSALGVGLNAEFYRAATPGLPYQVAIQRGVRMYHDQTTRPVHDMRWETLTLLAHGAFVTMIDKTAFDGSLDPVAYDRMGQVLSEARAKREHFGQTPIYDIGLYFSSRSRDWIGREKPGTYFLSFQGAHQACVMEQLQFGVILDENVSLAGLQKFPVVCLPNVGHLSAREVALLTEYVTTGGKLLITGQSGQFDSLGQPLATGVLEDLIGAKVERRLDSDDNWVSLAADSLLVGIDADRGRELNADWPFLVTGPATVYTAKTAAVWGNLRAPDRTYRQLQGRMGTEWPMSAGEVVGPAVLVNSVGQGRVVTCAGSPDYATASEHGLVENRELFRRLFRLLHPRSRVSVVAPANVEAVVTDDPAQRQIRVHLLAYHPTPRTTPAQNRPYVLPGLIEDVPIFRVQLFLTEGIQQVSAWHPNTQLASDGQTIQATVENIHEVLVIHY